MFNIINNIRYFILRKRVKKFLKQINPKVTKEDVDNVIFSLLMERNK